MLSPDLLLPETPRPLKRVEYDRLVALGVFENERVELLHGTLVAMSPQDPGHTGPIGVLTMLLVPALVGHALVRIQAPIVAADESEPEPDVTVVPLGSYRRAHPDHAHLVIEVALSSTKDRLIKAPLYAGSGFTEYWLADVTAGVVEVYRDADGARYRTVTTHRAGETLTLQAFPQVSISVDALFA